MLEPDSLGLTSYSIIYHLCHLWMTQFTYLWSGGNRTNLTNLWWGLNDLIYVKCLGERWDIVSHVRLLANHPKLGSSEAGPCGQSDPQNCSQLFILSNLIHQILSHYFSQFNTVDYLPTAFRIKTKPLV